MQKKKSEFRRLFVSIAKNCFSNPAAVGKAQYRPSSLWAQHILDDKIRMYQREWTKNYDILNENDMRYVIMSTSNIVLTVNTEKKKNDS